MLTQPIAFFLLAAAQPQHLPVEAPSPASACADVAANTKGLLDMTCEEMPLPDGTKLLTFEKGGNPTRYVVRDKSGAFVIFPHGFTPTAVVQPKIQ